MELTVRRNLVIREETHSTSGIFADPPLRKIALVSVIENPFVDRYVENLSPLVAASFGLGRDMAAVGAQALDNQVVQSYGKAGLVGLRGEQEHANALLTTTFANPLREMIGGADAWISSVTKVAAPGSMIDVPLNHIHDVYVRSHYDAMSFSIADMPMPDEIAIIFCFATRGRIGARVGGLTHDDVVKQRERRESKGVQ